ncbi:hypothetical protein FRB99_004978 [Tulasnella sp. 403]|nr:hypothetical protein FRB99_004978 [Tulasnella sp. 403]
MSAAEGVARDNCSCPDSSDEDPPRRRVIVVTCMDYRVDPIQSLELQDANVHVLRNAGGRAFDALRSIIASQQYLKTRDIYVLHHTKCGMQGLSDDRIRQDLQAFVSPNVRPALAPVIDGLSFLPFADAEEAVREDVAFLKHNPFVFGSSSAIDEPLHPLFLLFVMSVATEFAKANESYVESFGEKSSLSLPPARGVIVITCIDARIDPAASLGIKEGEAHVIRNAGGRAFDALRSVIISQQLLATRETIVFHHTDCGMLTFTDDVLRQRLRESVSLNARAAIRPIIDGLSFLPFSNLEDAIKEDVAFLQNNPLVPEETKITGWIYDVRTGKVSKVV